MIPGMYIKYISIGLPNINSRTIYGKIEAIDESFVYMSNYKYNWAMDPTSIVFFNEITESEYIAAMVLES